MSKGGKIMDGKNIALLLGAFVALIVGISLIGVTASQGNLVTDKKIVTNEAIDISSARTSAGAINTTYPITITNYPSGWKVTECPVSEVTYGNSSTDFTLTTDYTFTDTTGVLLLKNTNTVQMGNATNATVMDYTYCGDDYLTQNWSRTSIDLIPGFFAIALMLIAVGLFYAVLKNEGLLNL